jgi:hypothetical protein
MRAVAEWLPRLPTSPGTSVADKRILGGGHLTAATTAAWIAAALLSLGMSMSACGIDRPHAPTTPSTPAPQTNATHPAPTPVHLAIARLGLGAFHKQSATA